MPLPDGVRLPVSIYESVSSKDVVIPVKESVAKLKRQLSFGPLDVVKDCPMLLRYQDGTLQFIPEGEHFGDRLVQAKEIIVLSDKHLNHQNSAHHITSDQPYAWFDALPELTKNTRMTPGIACLISNCFGEFWESVIHRLGYTPQNIEIELHNAEKNVCRTITNFLTKWSNRDPQNATLGALMAQLKLISMSGCTVINWERLQQLVMALGK
ncbi:unnamed protein product [Lymnaea stagnalis]|uniref:Death domain-containing protein n=1 Tax=Lymnaea stagnalis TaxID=6523 RepID=A0AAV2HSW2_LYMST